MVFSRFWISFLGAVLGGVSLGASDENKPLSGPYFGQQTPGRTATVFAPGLVSMVGRYEYALSFAPKGDQFIFSTETTEGATLMYSKIKDGTWTLPEPVHLSNGAHTNEMEAFFSPDGKQIFFAPFSQGMDVRIWKLDIDEDHWCDPKPLPGPIATDPAFFPTSTASGVLYYTNIKEKKAFRAQLDKTGDWQTEAAGLEFGGHTFIASDGSFVLCDARASDSLGEGDIYVAFAMPDGKWSKPHNLGTGVNSSYSESCPSLSADERFLFFSRYDENEGISQIYWIDAAIIGEIRRQVLGDDTLIVKRTVVDSIAWALTKDRALLERIIAHDDDYFSFHPQGLDPVQGYDAFKKGFDLWMDPRFVATHTEVRDFRCHFAASKNVAWFSAILDDCYTWDGKAGCWKDTRWTGILEKRDGQWLIMQMHFSFAAGK